ncbi:uncharacterized protein LOC100845554 isoform X1 [Brachypodium distachyon]|uniref:Uncharacterized protein n=1 Tax=Brachypodium distachyon TaxID=15368 RepID=A0A0Q3H9P9_BRADI|nr:uncharacterized protein LOC100845554 isoform X1 [Brachypodium distachyon]KQK19639.1 hypothetical protein BRADI_1g49520v3 [Brachypodium distachyon]|eukprot:XP_003561112.1 uncharacterized protein LOC100845554 isoform X1 [Brachypodium distachyon]
MAAEVLVGAERRVLISAAAIPTPPPPPPESLLGRLDQIDLRLRQLEEEQRRRPSSASPDAAANSGRGRAHHHQHSKSMPSSAAMHHQQQQVLIRGKLMDRLDLLESRIRQLGSELDLGDNGNGNGKAPAEDRAWSEPPPLPEPRGDPRARPAAAASWSAVQILQRGARQLHHRNNGKPSPAKKVKKLKEAKCACEEEKRKAERSGSRASGRRWFTVGC